MRMISRASSKETLADSQMLPGGHSRGRKSSRRVTDCEVSRGSRWPCFHDAYSAELCRSQNT